MADSKAAHLDWTGEELDFHVRLGNGYEAEFGSQGASPMEMMLASVAGCMGMDVIHILQRKRQKVHALSIEIAGKRAEPAPRVYTEVDITIVVKGEGIKSAAVEQAIALSLKTYCSASAIFQRAGVAIRTLYRIEEVEAT